MATEAQTRANRLNARKSTGPRTPEGKAVCRRNAVKHGLAGGGDVLPGEDAARAEGLAAALRGELRPSTPREEELVERMAVDTVRLERCRALYLELCEGYAARARLCWDDDRRLAAEETAAGLARDPARVGPRLRATRQGCELLIERWEALGRVLRETGAWTEAQRGLALDLLGVPPELRDGTTAVDPPGPGPSDPRAFRLRVCEAQASWLRGLKASSRDRLDDGERRVAETGLGAEMSEPLLRLHRYESACSRRWYSALREVRGRGDDRGAPDPARAPAPAPAPAPPPAPRPAAGPAGPPRPEPPRPPAAAPAPAPAPTPAATGPAAATPSVERAEEPRRPNRRHRRYLAKLERRS